MKISLFIQKVKRRLNFMKGYSIEELRLKGAVIGENCNIYGMIDNGHEFLVTMGNNVTLASGSRVLTHDGSTKKIVGYSKVGRVDIGDDVFIGAGAIVLPNVKIGSRVIIGAGCIVAKDIPDNSVVVGNPSRIIGTYDVYVEKTKKQFETLPVWDTLCSNKTEQEKIQMREKLSETGYGFDV